MREREYEDSVAQQRVVQRVGKRDKDADAHRPEAEGRRLGKGTDLLQRVIYLAEEGAARPGLSAS